MTILRKLVFLMICLGSINLSAQEVDTLKLDLSKAESLLLENNLAILAEQLNIDIADAEKIQAKIWPNPTLSIEEFNPYVSDYQKRHAEEQASLFSENFGRYRQVSIQIEQLIYLAGKRKKQLAIAEVESEQAAVYLSDFLLNLKTEFRKSIFDFYFHQSYLTMLEEEMISIKDLVEAYKNQSEKGNVNKSHLIRLQSAELELRNEIIEEKNTLVELQSELLVLLNLPDETNLVFELIFDSEYDYDQAFNYSLPELQTQALQKRPDVMASSLDIQLADKELIYEKSLGVPDLTLSLNYDRGGGIYPDFVGLGLALDLPFFNPNKGNIKKAEIRKQQQNYYHDQHLIKVKADVREKFEKLKHLSSFFEAIDAEFVDDLDLTMQVYNRSFRTQSISILEFTDFMETYIETKQAIFNNQRNYLEALEELKYAAGIENILN